MLKSLSFAQRWETVSRAVSDMAKWAHDQSLVDCLKTMVKELDSTAVVELAYQIWEEDGGNMVVDNSFKMICLAVGKEGEYERRKRV